jgi:hypothetical protein
LSTESENRSITINEYKNQVEEANKIIFEKNKFIDQLKAEFDNLNVKFDKEVDGIVSKYENEVKVT